MAYIQTQDRFGVVARGEKLDPNRLYNSIKVGGKRLSDDVGLNLPEARRHPKRIDKNKVLKAIDSGNVRELRDVSELFFRKSGIYSRLCRYMANLYRYDLFVTPVVYDDKLRDTDKGKKKIIDGWYKSCRYLENCRLKRTFGSIALKVFQKGAFYGYVIQQPEGSFIQELPIDYCRSRYSWNGRPAVEFNVKFFDDKFADSDYRLRVVKLFPQEIQKAYVAYKKGTLPKDFQSDEKGWVLLDTALTVKFNIGNSDIPFFASVIPHIMDLEDAQELDKKKMMQQIMRIIVQKFPLNKNGDLIFDVDEMNAFHNMATNMLGDIIGVDVLSTLADVSVEDMSDNSNINAADQLEKVERTVYNEAGVASAMFNTDGNLALEKSVINDESSVLDLIYQFQDYAQRLLEPYNKSARKLMYNVQILPTTGYNYKDLSKMYKEQTTIGFSKLLPQVALGHSQSAIIATAYFENQTLQLDEVFIAPQMSSTMSSSSKDEDEDDSNGTSTTTVQVDDGREAGRPEKDDSEKSDKTIQNLESMQ